MAQKVVPSAVGIFAWSVCNRLRTCKRLHVGGPTTRGGRYKDLLYNMVKSLACPPAARVPVSEKRSSQSQNVADFVLPKMRPKKAKVSDHAPVLIGLQKFSDNSELSLKLCSPICTGA